MGAEWNAVEQVAPLDWLVVAPGDVVIRTDRRGFITQATPGLAQLGFRLPGLLVGPNLIDLAQTVHRDEMRTAHSAAVMGLQLDQPVEFRAKQGSRRNQWFDLTLRCHRNGANCIDGAIGLLRLIDPRKVLEDRLFAAEMTDPLTGLTNRHAFLLMLQHLIAERACGTIALVSIDHFKAINLRHGQAMGNATLTAFARFLRQAMREQDIVSRFADQSLAVILPETTGLEAVRVCGEMVATLAGFGKGGQDQLAIAASVGLSPLGNSIDETVRRAELALFAARAKGKFQVELARA